MVEGPNEPQSIGDAIAEAVGQSEFAAELDAEMDSGLELEADPPAEGTAAGEGESGTSDDPDGGDQSGATNEGGTDDPPPTTYWGTSLEGLSDEQRREVIAALEQRDSTIQKLQQKLAEEPPAPELEQDDDVEITDDDLLRAIGIDPEGDAFEVEQARRTSLPLARQIMALEETVEKLSRTESVRETAVAWNGELDRLEAELGELPVDRVKALQYAANEGITNPEVLYLRLTAPARKAVEDQVARIKAKKQEAGGLRPRNSDAGSKVFEAEGLSLRDTVKKAALEAQQETGKRWGDILRQR